MRENHDKGYPGQSGIAGPAKNFPAAAEYQPALCSSVMIERFSSGKQAPVIGAFIARWKKMYCIIRPKETNLSFSPWHAAKARGARPL